MAGKKESIGKEKVMAKLTTFERVREIIVEHLELDDDQVTLESDIRNDLATDSLDCYEIMISVEDEFDIGIKDEDANSCKIVQDLVNLVDRLVKEQC